MSNKSFCLVAALVASSSCVACGSDSGSDGSGSGGGGGSSQKIQACEIVTQAEAETLFGETPESEPPDTVDPLILGQCHWIVDDGDNNQRLQFYVFDGAEFFVSPTDSEPLALGDKGYIRVVPGGVQGLIDAEWVQSDMRVNLAYSAIGDKVPITQPQIDAIKALAASTSSDLQAK